MEDNKGILNPADLTADTYIHYCRLYLTDKIWALCPVASPINYGHVSRIVGLIDYKLFKNLNIETNKVLLLNYIYSTFLACTDYMLPKDKLYEFVDHLRTYDPSLHTRG